MTSAADGRTPRGPAALGTPASLPDSSGLRAILDAHTRSRRAGWSLRLIAGPPAVHRIFQITGTDQRLSFLTA